MVEPGDAGDLFDEVRLAVDIAPPARRLDLAAAPLEAERLEDAVDAALRQREPRELLDIGGIEIPQCSDLLPLLRCAILS